MTLPQATRRSMTRRTLVLALLLVVAAAATALAATINGDGTLIGTNGADTITAGNGNDTVYGLLGPDTITAGNGNDVLDGEGKCLPGATAANAGQYCQHGHGTTDGTGGQGDSVTAGNGNDIVYGGSGTNAITVGSGDDTIYGGPIADTIHAGPAGSQGNDRIYLDYGNTTSSYRGSTVYVAAGDDLVYATNGVRDTVVCPRGNQTTVYADRVDSTQGCKNVLYPRQAARRSAHRHGDHGHRHRHRAR